MGYLCICRSRAAAMNNCEVNPISEHYGLLQPCGSTVSDSICGPKGQTQNAFHGTAD